MTQSIATFSAPTLETERLHMRPPELQDFDLLTEFFASDRSKFVGGPTTREQSWRILAGEIGHWVLNDFGRWMLVEKSTGDTVGLVGLWHPHGFPENEIGWDLFEGATGKGYATEAALAARAFAYDTLGWNTLISLIAEGNDASVAVATRLGAKPDGVFTHERFGPATVYRHPSPEELSA